MATWMEMWNRVSNDAQQIVASPWLAIQSGFSYLTEAQHQLQSETGYIVRSWRVDLTTLDSDGAITLPGGVDYLKLATYAPTAALDPKTIDIISWGAMQEYIFRTTNGQDPTQVLDQALPQQGATIKVTVQYNKLYVYPFVGATGFVTVQYAPVLPAWAPSLSLGANPIWPNPGGNTAPAVDDPGPIMTAYSPEPEFANYEDAIQGYAMAQVVRTSPVGQQKWLPIYQDGMAKFDKGLQNLRRRNENYTTSRKPAYNIPAKGIF